MRKSRIHLRIQNAVSGSFALVLGGVSAACSGEVSRFDQALYTNAVPKTVPVVYNQAMPSAVPATYQNAPHTNRTNSIWERSTIWPSLKSNWSKPAANWTQPDVSLVSTPQYKTAGQDLITHSVKRATNASMQQAMPPALNQTTAKTTTAKPYAGGVVTNSTQMAQSSYSQPMPPQPMPPRVIPPRSVGLPMVAGPAGQKTIGTIITNSVPRNNYMSQTTTGSVNILPRNVYQNTIPAAVQKTEMAPLGLKSLGQAPMSEKRAAVKLMKAQPTIIKSPRPMVLNAISIPKPNERPALITSSIDKPVAKTTVAASSHNNNVHMVSEGETLYSISRKYGKSVATMVDANKLESAAHIRIGQSLIIPADQAVAAVIPTRSRLQKNADGAPEPRQRPVNHTQPMPATSSQIVARDEKKAPKEADVIAYDAKAVSNEETGAIEHPRAKSFMKQNIIQLTDDKQNIETVEFRWPVRGRIISKFGRGANGAVNDGINIEVPEGASIRAANDGVVIYSGAEVEGFGNLILVKHAKGYVSAYAHASELLARKGDKVNRGQIIARAGKTGAVKRPQLHFELRKGATPVNPLSMISG